MAVNGRFNLHYLGAEAIAYLDSFYGDDDLSPLHGGLPTDRFQASWNLASHRSRILAGGGEPDAFTADTSVLPQLYDLEESGRGEPAPCTDDRSGAGDPWLLAPIPADLLALCSRDGGLAMQWRMNTRRAFHAAFEAGYRVVDLLDPPLVSTTLPCYLLRGADSE
jgi:predicted GNAT superfamily acetyltransferase